MANLHDYFFRQRVSEQELDEGFEFLEIADQNLCVDWDFPGIAQGMNVGEEGVPSLNVEVSAGTAYTNSGERIRVPGLQVVDVSVDENSNSTEPAVPGNSLVITIFAEFTRALSDPRIDGNSQVVFFERFEDFQFVVRKGSEAVTPGGGAEAAFIQANGVANDTTLIRVVDILRANGQTQIFNADIFENVLREDAFVLTAGTLSVRAGTAEQSDQANLQELSDHINDIANAHGADSVDYDSTSIAAAWSALKAAAEVQAAIDGIEDDLSQASGVDGASLIGFDASGSNFVGAELAAALVEAGVLANAAPQAWTGQNDFDDARITDNNSLTDDGLDDDAARDTAFFTTATTAVATNLAKKLVYVIPTSGGEFLRLYAQGNGFDLTRNAGWDNSAGTWGRDAAADSHLWRFAINNGFEYIERLAAESDDWADTAWFIAGRHTGFGIASAGEEILVEDEGVLAPGPSNDTYSALSAINRGAAVTETVGVGLTYGFTFPANPSTATKTVITETAMGVAPSGGTLRPTGMNVTGTTNAGPVTWGWEVTFDVS